MFVTKRKVLSCALHQKKKPHPNRSANATPTWRTSQQIAFPLHSSRPRHGHSVRPTRAKLVIHLRRSFLWYLWLDHGAGWGRGGGGRSPKAEGVASLATPMSLRFWSPSSETFWYSSSSPPPIMSLQRCDHPLRRVRVVRVVLAPSRATKGRRAVSPFDGGVRDTDPLPRGLGASGERVMATAWPLQRRVLQRRCRLPLLPPGERVRPGTARFRVDCATAGVVGGPRLAWYSQCTHPIHPSCT